MSKKNSKVERSFGLSSSEIKELALQSKGKFINPHNRGNYRFIIEALFTLGANKFHTLDKVHETFRKIAGEEWYRAWKNKDARNEATGKDHSERFLQNALVLQRTNDYGKRLLDVGKIIGSKGCVIDLLRTPRGIESRLNLNSSEPMKLGRAKDVEKVQMKKAAKPQPKAKASKKAA